MKEKNRGIKPVYKIQLAREPVFVDGCEYASFIQVPRIMGLHVLRVIYALLEYPSSYTHSQIFEEAIENEYISGKIEPTGGGIFDLHNYIYLGSSIHYGPPDQQVINKLSRYLQKRNFDRGCD
jgi:hypothetical protein